MNSSNLANETIQLPSILKVGFGSDAMQIDLSDGRVLSVPLAWYPKLAMAERNQLQRFEISPGGYGIHWPELDEDLSVKGFLLP